jgi:hypothetical protein
MSKPEDKVVEFFNASEAVQVEEGSWYYHESSVEKELLSVYEQLAKANERVKELESAVAAAIHAFDAYEMDVDTYPTIEHVKLKNGLLSHLNKFALEQKIEALEECVGVCGFLSCEDSLKARIKQLRKGDNS